MKYRTAAFGFTLVEVLVVIAIIATLAAILFPVLSKAKQTSQQSVTTSNLRQCHEALVLYDVDANDWRSLPIKEVAWSVLGSQITVDPLDSWRKLPSPSPYEAMVGSFGYANSRLCHDESGTPISCVGSFLKGEFPVMISIFGDAASIPAGEYLLPSRNPLVKMPRKALTLWGDGHVKMENVPSGGVSLFNWSTLFIDVNEQYRKNGNR